MSEARDAPSPTMRILSRLLAERGIERFALFLVQQEGKMLAGGIEAISGFVLGADGKVHGFWLEWDRDLEEYVLDPWYRVEDHMQFAGDAEFRRARRRLGMRR